MQRTITPRAQVILDQAKDILAVHGLSLEHVVRIANALHIAKSMDLKPNVQWHEAEVDLSDLIANAFDYIED